MRKIYIIFWPSVPISTANSNILGKGHYLPLTNSARMVKAGTPSLRMLREVDAGAYSTALSGGRNNCTMREEKPTAQTDA